MKNTASKIVSPHEIVSHLSARGIGCFDVWRDGRGACSVEFDDAGGPDGENEEATA